MLFDEKLREVWEWFEGLKIFLLKSDESMFESIESGFDEFFEGDEM